MNQWQPIETAPRDGTFYLATDGKHQWVENRPLRHYPGEWHLIDGEWRGAAHSTSKVATHWMPLPEPPEEEKDT